MSDVVLQQFSALVSFGYLIRGISACRVLSLLFSLVSNMKGISVQQLVVGLLFNAQM